MNQITIRLSGPKSEIEALLHDLEKLSDLPPAEASAISPVKGSLLTPKPHGNIDIWQVLINFTVAASARLSVDLLLDRIRNRKKESAKNVAVEAVDEERLKGED